MPMIEVLKTLKTMQALTNFLEMGTAADILADIEFAAARKAFNEIPRVDDKRGQIWTCIGHLNSCYQANKFIYANASSNSSALKQITVSQNIRLTGAAQKARFLAFLLALCYAYLGEIILCKEHLKLAKEANYDPEKHASTLGKIGNGLWMLSYFFGAPLVYDFLSGPKDADIDAYKISDEDLIDISSQVLIMVNPPAK